MKFLRRLDFLLLLPASLLTVFGLVVLSSTSVAVARDQVVFALLGVSLFLIFSQIEANFLRAFSPHLYILSLLLLILTVLFGIYSKGATRWIPLGIAGLTFQPSELVKFCLIIVLSDFWTQRFGSSRLWDLLLSFLLILPPAALIFWQPDLGTTLVLISIWFVLTVSSIRFGIRQLLGLLLVFLVFTLVLFLVMRPYQRERILSFLAPSLDPLGGGYHALQSEIAVGSGRLWGRGFGRGTQSHLRFLPEYQTDFIFATLSEEWGFIGSLIVVLLFGFLLFRIVKTSHQADATFDQLICLAIFGMIFFQMLINIAMNLGIAPVTGVPLPLLSSGGSSLVLTLLSLGVVQSVASRSRRV